MKAFITQMMLIIFVLIVILIIFSIMKAFIRERRISSFTLSKDDINDISLFDRISKMYWNIINFLSKNLGESKILNALSHDYDKFIMTSEENYKSPINYITIKIITTILAVIVVVLLIIMNALPNNLLLLFLFIILGFFLPDGFWLINYYYKCSVISSKLYQSIIIISDNLEKINIYDAIEMVTFKLDGYIADEYKKVLIDLSYNIKIDEAFKRFYDRTKIKEIEEIYEILKVNNTNLLETFKLIRNRFDYINKKNSNIENSNSIINILSFLFMLLPLIFMILVLVVAPEYFEIIKLYKHGYLIVVILIILYILLILSIRKVLEGRK